jgi:hypothetical protein
MAKVIEFRVPENYKKKNKWVPPEERGKVLQFPAEVRKSA